MGFAKLVPAALLVFWTHAAAAQAWIEFKNEEVRFAVNFPEQPVAEDIEWISEDDAPLPAQKFTAQRGDSIFSVIVVDYREARPITRLGAEAHTAAKYRKLGEVTYDAFSQLDRISGLQLQITKASERRSFIAIHAHEGRLYVAEADVPLRAPPPGQFQQSLQILDENGIRIRYSVEGERLISTDELDIDPTLISENALYYEDGYLTPAQYQELLRASGGGAPEH